MFLYKTACVIALVLFLKPRVKCSLQEEEVIRWTNELGNELWNLGKTITKYSEIEGKYKYLNAQVEKKDPDKLLAEVVADIERMMDRKMDAVVCISQKAEEEAEAFLYNDTESLYTYYSSKHSSIVGESPIKLPESLTNNSEMYKVMKLNNDTHFYNLPVNTSHSSVHVPTNIYDRHKDAALAIQWSEALDEVFVQNYNSDPALSWQYFGSTSGIMRHYPAKRWENLEQDLFDCRIRTWFIEAATCTKDVVILLDNSGSMDGMGKHIGAFTAHSILDTFSNNDYINVMNYSSWTNYTVPCYKDMLVQATKENIKVFKEAINKLDPAEKTDLAQAMVHAFGLLKKYREIRGCSESSDHCNQAVMIITDGVSKNFSDVVIRHNFLEDGEKPVRIFTYLIGNEVVNAPETQWLSCANRGYYTHVQTLEQVTVSVLKYINVIARPLVLQAKEHPASWTHADRDLTYDDATDDFINEPYRLLTSVAVPAFDRNANRNNVTKAANLLGVAGTDVPIADIEKLTLPYKIGVNAYAFIVSNNGYVLMHPDLRPVFEGILTENYNSIDLTEVEQLDNDLPPREIDDVLLELRDSLVMGLKGSIHNVSVKYHYDNMRRITREQYDYYFAPIQNTPFSIALAFPTKYGNYSLDVGDEISKNRHTGANITDFFKGSNWKIHPKWVYCKYHYLEGHEFKTPEDELLHFLGKMYNSEFKWEKQYEAGVEEDENLEHVECGRKTHEDDDYYCDRQLVQRLVFDAKNTLGAFQGPWIYQQGESPLFEMFNATLRFVATMSGLTRWEYIYEEVENVTKKEFGDYHSQAIDETWYKSAVIQHQYDRESFVYSVPFDAETTDGLLVTGSYAIFPSDAGQEAPGSVVGFQFGHANLRKRVMELTNKVSNQCPECGVCNTTLECYVIDSSAYIIVSENNNNTGRFFGEIAGDIMDSMLQRGIFERVTLYDFQALCDRGTNSGSSGNSMLTPLDYATIVVNWFLLKLAWLAFECHLSQLWAPVYIYAQEDNLDNFNDSVPRIVLKPNEEEDEDDYDRWYDCEMERDLYILQQNTTLPGEIVASRIYYIKKIPFSNLLFVAINSTMPVINPITYSIAPRLIEYENETVYPCQKLNLNNLTRRMLKGCFNAHPKEREITACGKAAPLTLNPFTVVPLLLLSVLVCT